MRRNLLLLLLLCLALSAAPLPAAILERLPLDDLILKSTDIVRARVLGSHTDFRGSLIYTHWKIEVTDRWKGTDLSTLEVLVPGGSVRGVHQDVAGAPALAVGREYLFFLWRSKTGSTYITGLSQGIFDLGQDAAGLMVSRAASGEPMLERETWRPVKDEGIKMRYSDMISRISGTLAEGAAR